MKRLKFFSDICLLLTVAACVACAGNEEGAVAPVFPSEQQTVAVAPGQTVSLTFDANLDWKLYSSAVWCKFANGLTSINGQAGTAVTVPLDINADAWSLDDDVAEITLRMGGEEKVIARYGRGGFEAVIADVNGTVYSEENPLRFEYKNGDVKNIITFSANFDWKIEEESMPEWVTVNPESLIGGKGGSRVNVTFNVPKTYWVEQNTGSVTVKSMISDDRLTIPVVYAGLPEGVVEVDGVDGNPFWWKIAADGQTFWKDGSLDGTEPEKIALPSGFRVLARDNAYRLVVVEQYENWGMQFWGVDENVYLSLRDGGDGNIVIDPVAPNSDSERMAYIVLLSTAEYDSMMEQVNQAGGMYTGILLNDDDTDLNPAYDDKVVYAFRQETSKVEMPFVVTKNGFEDIACEFDSESETAKYIASEYGIGAQNICSVDMYPQTYLSVSPKFMSGEPTDAFYSAFYFTHASTGDDVYFEGGATTSGFWNVSFMVPSSSMYMIFNDGDTYKALIINVIPE